MKKYILILICALCTYSLNAQIRYLQINSSWSEQYNIPVDAIDSVSFGYWTAWYIDFTYKTVSENMYDNPTFYHVGAEIEFSPNTEVTPSFGDCRWDFGDGTPEITGDIVTHDFKAAGSYTVTLTTDKVKAQHTIHISEIYPLISIVHEGDIATPSTDISFEVCFPNPYNQQVEWQWSIPGGAVNERGETITSFHGTAEALGKLRFTTVGSHYVHLQLLFDGRAIEQSSVIVNITNENSQEAPTLYYAVVGGNVMALKLTDDLTNPACYDLGVSAGEHAFNLLFEDETLFLLDAGKQFYYVDDEYGTLGDGKISAIAKDGSKVETVISNVGGPAFQDPFYGYVENGDLYYADRNMGIVKLRTDDRDKVYSSWEFPYYVQNNTLNWYNVNYAYGAIGGCFGKVNGAWWWTKIYNGTGIFRFNDSDILHASITQGDASNLPFEGKVLLQGMYPKSFVYDKTRGKIYFTLMDAGYSGLYGCTLEELEEIGSSKTKAQEYQLVHENGSVMEVDLSGRYYAKEGYAQECVGICQLALDEATGYVYFGYRPDPDNTTLPPAGLMRYNPATGKVETVVEGVEIYGCVINPTPSKVF